MAQWSCGACTLLNDAASRSCAVCGTTRKLTKEERSRLCFLRPAPSLSAPTTRTGRDSSGQNSVQKQDGNAETVSSENTAQTRPDCAYAGFVSWVIKSTVMPSKGGDGACRHLISTSEAEFASMFIKLMDDADCRSLYGRLIFRKGNVFRRSEILSKYGSQMDRAISVLVDIGLIDLPLMASGSATAEEIS